MRSTKELSLMALFLGLLIISAYIQIPLPTPFMTMHITMQLFVSILTGFCLRPKTSLITLASYLLVGLAGLPVFASGGGFYYLFKPTFGFLLGFLACSVWISYKKQKNNPQKPILIGLQGLFLYYLIGNLYYYFGFRLFLQTQIPLSVSLFNGFVISIIPDLLICIVASLCAKRLYPIYRLTNSSH